MKWKPLNYSLNLSSSIEAQGGFRPHTRPAHVKLSARPITKCQTDTIGIRRTE